MRAWTLDALVGLAIVALSLAVALSIVASSVRVARRLEQAVVGEIDARRVEPE